MKFKNRKLLFYMEIKFRLMRIYKRRVDKMILNGDDLSASALLSWHRRYEKQLGDLCEIKERFEEGTGEKVVFWERE